jgi:uncharacterized membrane protein YfcA
MILNWIKVPYYYMADLFDTTKLIHVLWLMPLVPAGVWIGKRFGDRVDKQRFDVIIIVLLMIAGVLLLWG